MTSGDRCFLDTNVLLYAFDDTQPTNQAIARKLIERFGRERRAVLSTQVLIELFHNLVRKFKVAAPTASLMTAAFCEWPVIDSDNALVLKAMARASEHGLSIWDAMVVEAAIRSGVGTLYSEDMPHGQRFGDLVLLNPFTALA